LTSKNIPGQSFLPSTSSVVFDFCLEFFVPMFHHAAALLTLTTVSLHGQTSCYQHVRHRLTKTSL